jgi:hypothetical protein
MASICFSGSELSKLLGVSPAALSKARSLGHQCGGYPVADWAEFRDGGALMGYLVPPGQALELQQRDPASQELIEDIWSSTVARPRATPTASMPALTPRTAIAPQKAAQAAAWLQQLIAQHPCKAALAVTGLLIYVDHQASREG